MIPPTQSQSNPVPALRLGLTGGMGCGKSTAAGIFRELGFGVADADALVRELLDADAEVGAAVRARWGGRVLKTSNAEYRTPNEAKAKGIPPVTGLDRRRIAGIVFADPAELAWLEELLHPRVRAAWQAAVAADSARDWVVEIPLLFEKSLASHFDFTLCVWAHPAIQARRLAARGLAPVEIAARQARQWPLEEKAARADFVLDNDGHADFLRRQIERLARRLRTPLP